MKGKGLLDRTFIYAIGNFSSKVLGFILIPILSFYLSPDEIGLYDLFLVIVALVLPCMTLQIGDAAYRWLSDVRADNEGIQRVITISNTIVALGFFIVFFVFVFLSISGSIQNLWLLFGLVATMSLFQFFQQIVRGIGREYFYSFVGFLNALFNVLFIITSFQLTSPSFETVVLSTILANLLSIAIIVVKYRCVCFFKIEKFSISEAKEMLHYSIPLIPNSLSWWLMGMANRFLILFFLGLEYNGIFAIAARFASILVIFNSVIVLSLQDFVLENKENINIAFGNILDLFVRLMGSIVLIFIPLFAIILPGISSKNLIQSGEYWPVLLVGALFGSISTFMGVGYVGIKKTVWAFYSIIAGSVVNLFFTFLLISKIGLYAPSIGLILGNLTILVVRFYYFNKIVYVYANWGVWTLLGLGILATLFLTRIENVYVHYILLSLSLFLSCLVNRAVIVLLIQYMGNYIPWLKKLSRY